jgi:hypothetical protein
LEGHPHLVGGLIRGRTPAAVDPAAVDVEAVDVEAVDVEADRTPTVALADPPPLDADHLARFGDPAEVEVLITDSAVERDLVSAAGSAGPKVVQA